MSINLPEGLSEILTPEIWENWSKEQKEYIIENEGKPIGEVSVGEGSNIRYYSDKTWALGTVRKRYLESCEKCDFDYCFYAVPRNWSMRSSSDVWNVMKCANVKCQSYFDSCL